MSSHSLLKSLQTLQKVGQAVDQTEKGSLPSSTSETTHEFQPRGLVWTKKNPQLGPGSYLEGTLPSFLID